MRLDVDKYLNEKKVVQKRHQELKRRRAQSSEKTQCDNLVVVEFIFGSCLLLATQFRLDQLDSAIMP